VLLALCLAAAFGISAGAPAEAAAGSTERAAEVRKAIQAIQGATNRSLAALCASDRAGHLAVLHPDFQAVGPEDPKDRDYPERAAQRGRERVGFVLPQQTRLDDSTTAQMHLSKATSTITTITMPRAGEAIVAGEETLVWTRRHGADIVVVAPDGSRSVTPNTEQRTIIVTYRRYWVKTDRGWLLKRSRALSEKATAIL
jgi:ketosteroid isomerase-like protein